MAPSKTSRKLPHGRLPHIVLILLLTTFWAVPAFSESDLREEGALKAETPAGTAAVPDTHTTGLLQAGYRFISPDGPTAAAMPYGRLKSGMAGGFSAATLSSDLKLVVDGTYLHEDDYHSELFADYAGLVRVHAESGALWHNLLREQVNPGSAITLRETDAGRSYGTRSAISQVDTRIKLGNNPFHLNIGYWELKRDGYEQLRFSDHAFGSASNAIISEAARVDRITREGTLGLDGHFGPVDLSYGFLIRDFTSNAADSRFSYFNSLNNAVISQPQAHDVIPDSRVTAHTVKMFSDLSGGLVGSAAYSLIQRENSGGHGDAVPARLPRDTIHAVAGDLSYTPIKELSVALKYRHQAIDRETPLTVAYPFGAAGLLAVRPASDTVRDTLTLSTTLRPLPGMIYRLEYQVEREARSNAWDPLSAANPAALHDDSRQTHTGRAQILWKPYKGLNLNASYSYAASDNPLYGTSFTDRHTGKFIASYVHSGAWGLTGSYLVQYETGQSSSSTLTSAPLSGYALPRSSRSDSANASVWFSPLKRLTITGNYSYLSATSVQTLLLSNLITDPDPRVVGSYRSTAHVYGIDAAYALADPLDIALSLQQVRSRARFDLPARSFLLNDPTDPSVATQFFDTGGISELSRLDSIETGVSARLDWRITDLIGCMIEYGYRQFDSGNPVYDGAVHTTMLHLKARW